MSVLSPLFSDKILCPPTANILKSCKNTQLNLHEGSSGNVTKPGAGCVAIWARSSTHDIHTMNSSGFISSLGASVSRYIVGEAEAGDTPFTSIQAAINQAKSDGAGNASPAFVFIRAGEYKENVAMADGVTIAGASQSAVTIRGTVSWNAVTNADLSDVSVVSPAGTPCLSISNMPAKSSTTINNVLLLSPSQSATPNNDWCLTVTSSDATCVIRIHNCLFLGDQTKGLFADSAQVSVSDTMFSAVTPQPPGAITINAPAVVVFQDVFSALGIRTSGSQVNQTNLNLFSCQFILISATTNFSCLQVENQALALSVSSFWVTSGAAVITSPSPGDGAMLIASNTTNGPPLTDGNVTTVALLFIP